MENEKQLTTTDQDSTNERQAAAAALSIFTPAMGAELWRAAEGFAASSMIPAHYQGNPANCYVACTMAHELGLNPIVVMQGLYEVHGKIGFESKFAVGLANARGPFRSGIQYELNGDGDGASCTAYAIHRDGTRCESTVSMAMAKAEGWTTKSGSKWKTIPEQMLRYRSAMFLIRAYCPEVLLGLQSTDELLDVGVIDGGELHEVGATDKVDGIVADAVAVNKCTYDDVVAVMASKGYDADAGGQLSEKCKTQIQDAPDQFRKVVAAYVKKQRKTATQLAAKAAAVAAAAAETSTTVDAVQDDPKSADKKPAAHPKEWADLVAEFPPGLVDDYVASEKYDAAKFVPWALENRDDFKERVNAYADDVAVEVAK